MDKQQINKVSLTQVQNDTRFWLSQTPQARIEALESIRQEYNSWKYGTEQRFQRVYRVTKLK